MTGTKITGTLKLFDGWASGPLAGEGYFMALTCDDIPETATAVKVGLVPSQDTGMVELDSDKDAVFKISDKRRQQLRVDVIAGGKTTSTAYDLSGLTLTDAE